VRFWRAQARASVDVADRLQAPPLTAASTVRAESQRVVIGYRMLWWTSLVWLVVLVLGGISDGFLREEFFSSDHLYIPALIDDLTRWGGSLYDWRLTPAPYFFPDLPLYAMWRFLGVRLEWAQYLGGISHLLLVLWASRALIEAVLGANALAASIVGPVFVLAVALHLGGMLGLVQPLFILSNHGGAASSTLVTLALLLGSRTSRTRLLLTFAFAFVSGWSDPLFAPSCGAPLALIGLYLLIVRRRGGTHVEAPVKVSTLLVVAAGSLLGAEVTRVMQMMLSDLRIESHPELSALSWSKLIDDLTGPARGELTVFVGGALLAIGTLWRLRGRGSWERLRILALFQLISSVGTFAAVVWAGNYVDVATLRYVLVPFSVSWVLAATLLATALGRMPIAWRLETTRALSMCAAAGLLATLGWQSASLLRGQYASNERATSSCVEEISRGTATDVVLAGYWFAKPLMLFSPDHVKVLQMQPGMKRPYWWINSRNWYRGEHAFGVIATNGLDTNGIRKSFGKPQWVTHCGDVELFVYMGKPREHLQHAMQNSFDRFVHATL
jgi:hypothetical protein